MSSFVSVTLQMYIFGLLTGNKKMGSISRFLFVCLFIFSSKYLVYVSRKCDERLALFQRCTDARKALSAA